jgi:hypothetical protein
MVSPDEIRDINDIDEEEANELREMVHKVVKKHPNEFAAEDESDLRTDAFVVQVYKDLHGPHWATAHDILFPEEIAQSTIDALVDEGEREFFSDRETYEEEEDALKYSTKYAQVALSVLYPYLFRKKQRLPQDS